MLDSSRLSWRKSSRSSQNGACVEVGTGRHTAAIGVRDSKNPQLAGLVLDRPAFRSFVAKLKAL